MCQLHHRWEVLVGQGHGGEAEGFDKRSAPAVRGQVFQHPSTSASSCIFLFVIKRVFAEDIMGHISYSDAIAILQIVYYSPALIASLFVCFRHGFAKSFGWYFLVTFCLSRLIGASGQLDTIAHPNSSTAWTIALVCSVMGTSPLLLSTLGLLSRT